METKESVSKKIRRNTINLALWIILYIILSITIFTFIPIYFPIVEEIIETYKVYINLGIVLFFGYMILKALSETIYWTIYLKYPKSTASAIKSLVQIIGLGGLVSGIAGASAGGAASVALGGFMGMVIGYASQHVLGQAIAGLFILIVRPVKVGDNVTVAGETGTIEEITTLFTYIKKEDDSIALIPNNMLIGQKIYILKADKSEK